jgi:glycosyltransferase involved in cell wall biosynthesis
MKKIRILHIIPNFGTGGAERLVVSLLEATDKERFEAAAVSLYQETGTLIEKEIKEKRLKVYYLDKHPGLDLRMILELYRLFRTYCPDVVHTHRYVLRYVLLPALFCRVSLRVHTVHNIAQNEVDSLGKLVHWIAFRLANVVPVSISRAVAKTVNDVYGQNIYTPVIYNGIPTRRFVSKEERNGTRAKVNAILLHIGRFEPQKNHQLLIEALAFVVIEYPRVLLWLVGDGLLRPAIERLVIDKGLEENVLFIGEVHDVKNFLADSDIFILSSDWEGFGIVIAEAMAAGKPVVSTAVDGVPELVEDGVTGILVPPRDPKALAQGILQLIKDPGLRQSLGDAAQQRVIERFDISKTAKEYEALYLRLLQERGRA